MKYVKNVLKQYEKDGLAFQRYGRNKQDGLGDDILSGNSLSIIGLYQAIYGINPLYNRFYLNPHMTKELAGTQLKYNYRNQRLTIDLDPNRYAVSTPRFKIRSKTDFGFFSSSNELLYFNGNTSKAALNVITVKNSSLELEIKEWNSGVASWTQSSKVATSNKLIYQLNELNQHSFYTIMVNGKKLHRIKSNSVGSLVFEYKTTKSTDNIIVLNQ
ncbi:MAG: hypothetical protein ABIR66_11615 [Saprospiraceae bacterium]